jgi:cytochrome P450
MERGAAPIDVDLFDPRTYLAGLPHSAFATLRRDHPVYWQEERALLDWPEGPGYWAITRFADVDFVNRSPALFSSNLGATQIRDPQSEDLEFQRKMLLNLDPPAHSRLRRIVSEAFTPKAIAMLESRIRAHVREAIERVPPGGRCDFVHDLSADLPVATLADVMGVPREDRHLLHRWANRVIGFQDPEYAERDEQGRPIDAHSKRALADMFAYARELAAEKRRHPADDILTTLLEAEIDGDRLSAEEYENFFFLLSVAGNETLRNAIPGGMLALLEHPEEERRLRANPALFATALDEMLRYASPVMCFRRTASSDVELHGTTIRAGDKVVVYYAAANFDESVFAEADRFDVGRTPNDHFALGSGPHYCLGAALARLEMRVFFEELFRARGALEIDGPIVRLQSNFQSGIKQMPVRFVA